MTHIRQLRVNLAERSYDIIIAPDSITSLGEHIQSLFGSVGLAIVTDETVAHYHLEKTQAVLKQAGFNVHTVIMPAGEPSKSWHGIQQVVDSLLEAQLERGDIVIALGGGVIGDLTGFAASIARRGMAFIQVPTTLLAQVDSSVGGKTGINTIHGKNLVGTFHQPALVIADTSMLDTLTQRDFKAGYAEIAKIALINDKPFFEWLETQWSGIFKGTSARGEAIARACQAKAYIVTKDEREGGIRALLNLGHTFGHALEAATSYDSARLVHGEAVSIGTTLAYQFSYAQGFCSSQDVIRVSNHLKAIGLPTKLQDIPDMQFTVAHLMHHIAQDKKVTRGTLTFILARGIGDCFIAKNINAEQVEQFLKEQLKQS